MRAKADLIGSGPAQGCVLTFLIATGLADTAAANPTGLTVQSGSATAVASGSKLTVTTSKNAFLNWQSFNIAAGETTVFNQPSSTSVVLNQIGGQSASQIYGNLQANGLVVLINSSGFYLGPNSFVSTAGLVLSTAKVAPSPSTGGAWEFDGPAPQAGIINYGQINVGKGGSAYLIAENVQNNGSISAPEGSIGLVGGQDVLLSERPDGRGLSVKVNLPAGSVDNAGFLQANGGNISLDAQAVNQGGVIQANSVKNENGVIELVASDNLTLGANSQISASGDSSAGGSAGGSITLQSGNTFSDAPGSQVSANGGSQGGNGGDIEISAPDMSSLNSSLEAAAQPGSTAGELSLDPNYIVLGTSGSGGASGGTVLSSANPGTLNLNVNSAFSGFSQITLEARDDITLADGTDWNLSGSTGQTSGSLTLEAGRNIIFGDTTGIYDFNNWSVNVYAGVGTFSPTQPVVTPGAGSIYLNAYNPNNSNNNITDPSGFIETSAGSINLVAGQDVIVGLGSTGVQLGDGSVVNEGSVTTMGGGNISVHALAGDIDTGGTAQGYAFHTGISSLSQAYNLTDGLGGISTGAGGNVNLTAGGDIMSTLANSSGYYYDGNFESGNPNGNKEYDTGGAGAYGSQAGNVTIVAGGDVTGDYTVANGVGGIYAGVEMDASGNPVKNGAGNYVFGTAGNAGNNASQPNLGLNLVDGGWNVTAANDIILQEVRNPNGIFDVNGGTAYDHLFDYGPDDYVNLNAGNLVQLGAASAELPRSGTTKVPVIYPPILNVTAGAGGLQFVGDTFYNSLTLFPSPAGSLTIDTTGGGSVFCNTTSGGAPYLFDLVVSDSGSQQYKTSSSFSLTDHAATPVHAGHETPIDLNISGSMDDVYLGVPEAATISVAGSMNNCSFQGMNLAPGDVTSINVAGNIDNRSAFTSASLTGISAPDLSDLALAVNNSIGSKTISAATLAASLYYDPATQTLTYQNIPGVTIAQLVHLLQNLTVQVYQNGVPQWQDSPFDTIPVTTTVSVLNSAAAQALENAYNLAGGIPTTGGNISTFGYILGGGGAFDITANNMDLGTTAGIQSEGVGLYQVNGSFPLAKYTSQGADISVNLSGDLTMVSSSIASENGGNIFVNAGGEIDVGTSEFTVNSSGARGIYTTADSDVFVSATDDININGSRIAAYNGGNLTVISREGSIDAGSGGGGAAIVPDYSVNPATHAVSFSQTTIPGSGILATAYNSNPGDILVEAPNGTINASAGGISQLALIHQYPAGTTLENISVNQTILDEIFAATLDGDDSVAGALQHAYNGVAGNVYLDVFAGYALEKLDGSGNPILDSHGNPEITAGNLLDGTQVKFGSGQDINANGSGIVGAGNVNLNASGSIAGNIFGLNNVNISAIQNVNVVAVGLGTVSVGSQAGTITGTIIGVGGVSASGSSIEASLESNGSISGATSGQTGMTTATAANAGTAAASANTSNQTAATGTGASDDDDLKKKKGKPVSLAQKVSRVTVILPGKNGS